jgi:hypothetical protein
LIAQALDKSWANSLAGRPAMICQVRRGKPGYRGHPTANKQIITFFRNFKKSSETLSGFLEIFPIIFSYESLGNFHTFGDLSGIFRNFLLDFPKLLNFRNFITFLNFIKILYLTKILNRREDKKMCVDSIKEQKVNIE